jgi:hypothetical protein
MLPSASNQENDKRLIGSPSPPIVDASPDSEQYTGKLYVMNSIVRSKITIAAKSNPVRSGANELLPTSKAVEDGEGSGRCVYPIFHWANSLMEGNYISSVWTNKVPVLCKFQMRSILRALIVFCPV